MPPPFFFFSSGDIHSLLAKKLGLDNPLLITKADR